MTCLSTKRTATASVVNDERNGTVRLSVWPDGVEPHRFRLTIEEARELAGQLLKATGVKFTLSI